MNKKAFTLIEILIVVSVIGALASVILLTVTNFRSTTRDVFRVSELSKLQKAVTSIQVLGDDYPPSASGVCAVDNCPVLNILVQKSYLGSLPKGPRSNDHFYYFTGVNGTYEYFIVYAFVENANNIQGFTLPATGTDWCAQNLAAIGNYYCMGGYHER